MFLLLYYEKEVSWIEVEIGLISGLSKLISISSKNPSLSFYIYEMAGLSIKPSQEFIVLIPISFRLRDYDCPREWVLSLLNDLDYCLFVDFDEIK